MSLQHAVIQMESGEFVLLHTVLDKLLKLSEKMKSVDESFPVEELEEVFEAYESGIREVKVSLEVNLIEG